MLGKTQMRGPRSHPGGSGGGTPQSLSPLLSAEFRLFSSDDVASDSALGTDTGLVEEICSQAQQAVSQVIKASAAKAGGDAANKPQAHAKYVSPDLSKATVFKPGVEEKFWSRTGLAKEYMPRVKEGKYSCPLCPSYDSDQIWTR